MLVFLFTCFVIGLARLPIEGPECNIYLEKFGTANNEDGSGATKLAFSGDVSYIIGTSNLKVNLRYSDVDRFNDLKFFGLVQEDGKKADETCLDLKLYKFTSNQYADGIEVTDLPITPSNNLQKQWRYYSFIIPGEQFETRLVKTSNSNQYIYKGYYAIAYYAAGTDQLQYTFYFDFAVVVDRMTNQAETAFTPLSRKATASCNPNELCENQGDSILKWCTDLTCTAFAQQDLHENDLFVILQMMNTSDKNDYYLIDTEVWFTGDGILQKATPIFVNNSIKGQAIIQLQADIAWNNLSIQVSSILSTSQFGERRLLAQVTYDTYTGRLPDINCIKAEGAEICPNCEQECEVNGFAHDGCEACNQSNLTVLLLVVTFLFMMI